MSNLRGIARPLEADDSAFVSTMSTANTPAQNMTAWNADITAAIAAGKTLFIPSGAYPWGYTDGSQLTTNMSGTNKLVIRGAPGGLTRLVLSSGSSTIPWIVTTESVWVDYPVTAIATVTSGANINTSSEVSKVTATGSPTYDRNEMISVWSNDRILYQTTPLFELNYPNEISEVLSQSGNDIYLGRKLLRTYTVANTVKLRRYNNSDVVIDIDDLWFDTDGDIHDAAILTASRPAQTFEIRGFRHGRLGAGFHTESAWAGGPSLNNTFMFDYQGTCNDLINKTASDSPLGYCPRVDGANLGLRVGGSYTQHARHAPTVTMPEEERLVLGNTGYTATTTTLKFSYTTTIQSTNPAVNDLLYVDMSAAVGTINTLPVGWYTISARSGNSTSGTVTITTASDYSALAFTSGTGKGDVFQPDQVRRYGECEGMCIHNPRSFFSTGAANDSHENERGTVINDGESRFGNAFTWTTNALKAINWRGCGLTVNGYIAERMAYFADLATFELQHGMENICVFNNIILQNQSNRAARLSYFTTSGSSAVTDKRELRVNNLTMHSGFHCVLYQAADSCNSFFRNVHAYGDYGETTVGQAMFRVLGGEFTLENSVIDFTASTTADIQRIFSNVGSGTARFKNCHFKGISTAASSTPFSLTTTTSIIEFHSCTFEYASGATDGTVRTIQVDNITGTVRFFGVNRIINAAKISTANGFVRSSAASGNTTIEVYGRFESDAAFTMAMGTSSGVYTLKYMDDPVYPVVKKNSIGTTAVGNITTGEDNLITATVIKDTLYKAGKGVRITAWGSTANNANAKTLKLYFGTAVILTNALTTSQVNTWRMVAEVFSTGADAQDYVAQFLQSGTTSQIDIEVGTATQDDGAAITIKCTGEATATNDIVQEGLLVEIL